MISPSLAPFELSFSKRVLQGFKQPQDASSTTSVYQFARSLPSRVWKHQSVVKVNTKACRESGLEVTGLWFK
jgi:hypothetical protein